MMNPATGVAIDSQIAKDLEYYNKVLKLYPPHAIKEARNRLNESILR